MERVALITGLSGWDDAPLVELLLDRGYEVHVVEKRPSAFRTARLDQFSLGPHEQDTRYFQHYGDLTDAAEVVRIVQETQPGEIYNLAAQGHSPAAFETAEHMANADGLGTLRLLEAMRALELERRCRFYQGSTSELYGGAAPAPQNEATPFRPASPCAAARLYAYWVTVNYRETFGLHASNGILFGREGAVRGDAFLTRRITRGVAAITQGLQRKIHLGNLDARRDWCHPRDCARAILQILQQETADDYVVATGDGRTVREFVERAFSVVGRRIAWRGEGVNEIGLDDASGETLIEVDPRHYRPDEPGVLRGDAAKARQRLGWSPRIGFDELVRDMVESDMEAVARERRRCAV